MNIREFYKNELRILDLFLFQYETIGEEGDIERSFKEFSRHYYAFKGSMALNGCFEGEEFE